MCHGGAWGIYDTSTVRPLRQSHGVSQRRADTDTADQYERQDERKQRSIVLKRSIIVSFARKAFCSVETPIPDSPIIERYKVKRKTLKSKTFEN